MYHIASIGGDGIGPEIIMEGKKVLDAVSDKYNFSIKWTDYDIGAERYLKDGILLDEDDALDDADFMDDDDEDGMPRVGAAKSDEYEEYTIEDDRGWVDDEEEVEKGVVEEEDEEEVEKEGEEDDEEDPYRRGGFY